MIQNKLTLNNYSISFLFFILCFRFFFSSSKSKLLQQSVISYNTR